jgi:hypothetical protein
MHGGHPPHPMGRIAHVGHRLARFFRVLDKRDHQRLGARVHRALDQHLIVPRQPHHGCRWRTADGAQDMRKVRDLDRHVLHINHEEVETRVSKGLGGGGGGGHQPCAQGHLLRQQLAEGVHGTAFQ